MHTEDDSPSAEDGYRARFLFDPNSISVSGNGHYILKAYSASGQEVLRIKFGPGTTAYRLAVEARKDNGQWLASGSYNITDNFHTVEAEWRAATGSGANNGVLRLWIDGTLKYEYTVLDNDTWRIDTARLGYPNASGADITGTFCLDYFESRRENYMGTVPGAHGCSAALGPEGARGSGEPAIGPYSENIGMDELENPLFADGFESGDTSAWTVLDLDGDLTVLETAALTGTYGLAVAFDDSTPAYVRDTTPDVEATYSARFYFDTNGLSFNSGNLTIFRATSLNEQPILIVNLGYQPGAEFYQLELGYRAADGNWAFSSVADITAGLHWLEIHWGAASDLHAADGWVQYWIDGELAFADLAVDNGGQRLTAAEMGAVEVPDTTASGTLCFDDFASAESGFIGAVLGAHGCTSEESEQTSSIGGGQPGETQPPESSPAIIYLPFTANDPTQTNPPGSGGGETIDYTTVITYTYDALYRLTGAIYNDGNSYSYEYDSVGNRTELQHCLTGVGCNETTYTYDIANRLTGVDAGTGAVSLTWDGNGNLRNDGVNEYFYDSANRLTSFDDGETGLTFAYNGLGNRLLQIVGVTTMQYTLDLTVGLTQVLADEESVYIYGRMRLAQHDGVDSEYFLGDALGSVRQLVDQAAEPTLAQAYQPFGEELASIGVGATNFGFTGEWTDAYSKLVYLRSRYYAPESGRFLTRDVWRGDYSRPLSLNGWIYVEGNPVNRTDPTGNCPGCPWDFKVRVSDAGVPSRRDDQLRLFEQQIWDLRGALGGDIWDVLGREAEFVEYLQRSGRLEDRKPGNWYDVADGYLTASRFAGLRLAEYLKMNLGCGIVYL